MSERPGGSAEGRPRDPPGEETGEAPGQAPGQAPGDAPTLPDLVLLRPIGSGSFGTVWLARNATTSKRCAVKVIPRRSPGRADAAGREIVSLTRVEERLRRGSPHLLAIHHVGTTEDHLFYVMDLADREGADEASPSDSTYVPATLEGRLRRGALDARSCLGCARDLLAGLGALHETGMVHRDVKPSNCLFVDGRLRLADFGLVAPSGPDVSRIGTPTYMPPDGRMDFHADVWAAGLVIYEMLSGHLPGRFPHLGRRAAEIAGDPVLRGLLRVSLRACERDPSRRFADAGEMAEALEDAIAGTAPDGSRRGGAPSGAVGASRGRIAPSPAKSRPSVPRGRRAVLAAIAAAVLAVLAILALVPGIFPDRRVSVTFITEPYAGATVILDGHPALGSGVSPGGLPDDVPDDFSHGLPDGLPDATLEGTLEGTPPASLPGIPPTTPPAAPLTTPPAVPLTTPPAAPLTTPCTIDGLPARPHRVAFRLAGHPDLDAGTIDFRRTRQVTARWPSER